MPLLQAPASTSSVASWTANDSVTVGAVENATAAINIGSNAVAQPINVGTAGARSITIGNTTGATTVTVNVGTGGARVNGLRTTAATTAAAIAGATALAINDSGGIFTVSQAAAYDIDLPSPTVGAGLSYRFFLGTAGANSVTITVLGGAATFIGTIANDITSVIPCTGATITFVTGTAALGDSVEIFSLTTGLYGVRAITSAAGGITIA